jgi:hypothetical protein
VVLCNAGNSFHEQRTSVPVNEDYVQCKFSASRPLNSTFAAPFATC